MGEDFIRHPRQVITVRTVEHHGLRYIRTLLILFVALVIASVSLAPVTYSQAVVKTVTVGNDPYGAAYDSAKGEVFVVNYGSDTVSVISDANNAVNATVTVGSGPYGVAYDSGVKEVFVTNEGSNTVSVISAATNAIVETVSVGSAPIGVAYDSAKGEVFVANYGSGTVSVISDATNAVNATVTVGSGPIGVAYDSGVKEVFVTNEGSNTVSVISAATNAIVKTVSVGSAPIGVAYDSAKGEVFVANEGSGKVSVISDATNAVNATVTVGSGPIGVAYDSGVKEVFVTNDGSNTVSVISAHTNAVTATVTVGHYPIGAAYDFNMNEVFVVNDGSGTVSVISDSASPVTSTTTLATTSSPYTDTATVTSTAGTPAGSVQFYFCGPTTLATPCTSTSNPDGSAVTLISGSATSPAEAPTAVGWYCWAAIYTPGTTAFTGSSSTTTASECFQIAGTTTTTTATTSSPYTDTARVTSTAGTPAGSVQFYFCGPTTLATPCTSTSNPDGSAVTLISGSATSPAEAPTAVGWYCWAAIYTPGTTAFTGSSSTTTASECFQITGATTTTTTTATTSSPYTDTATVTSTAGTPAGSVQFYFCGATVLATPCAISPLDLSGLPVTLVSGSATSAAVIGLTAPGYYCWAAVYIPGTTAFTGSSSTTTASECFQIIGTGATTTTTTTATTSSPYTDTARVTSTAGTPAGSVQFYFCGPTTLATPCTSTSNPDGSAVTLISGSATSPAEAPTAPGYYCWAAVYIPGTTAFTSSSSTTTAGECFPIVGTTTTTTLAATSVPYTDTATVTSSAGTPTGTVSFYFCGPTVSATSCAVSTPDVSGSPVTLVSGSATSAAVTAPPPTATNTYYCWSAVYTPDTSNFTTSQSTTTTNECFQILATVGSNITTLTVVCSATSVAVGSATTCQAAVAGLGSPPTGNVWWSAVPSGKFSSTACGLSFYSYNSYYYSACSVKFAPTAPPGSPVILTANYVGDSQKSPSTGTSNLVVTLRATTTTVSCTPRSAVAGSLTIITCKVKVTGSSPTGTVTWSQSGVGSVLFSPTTCSLSTGSCSVALTGISSGTAKLQTTYGGDSNNRGSSRTTTVSIKKAPTAVAVSCTQSSLSVGSAITCTATVSGIYSSHTGTVTWTKASGKGRVTFSSKTCTLSSGSCSVAVGVTTAGSFTIKATYGGDSNSLKNSGAATNKASPTITPSLSSTAVIQGQSVTDSATLSYGYKAGGAVAYEYFSGNTCTGAATAVGFPKIVTNGVVPVSVSQVFVTVGSYSWNAVYSGDANNNGATSPCQSLVVNSPGVLISAVLSASTVVSGSLVTGSATLTGATSTAGGTVTYEFFSGSYCSGSATTVGSVAVTNGVPTSASQVFSSPGSYSWNAVYSGDANNNGATSPCKPLSIRGIPSIATSLSVPVIGVGGSVFDASVLTGTTSTAGGSVQYEYFSGSTCTGTATPVGPPVPVTNGVVPNSVSWQLGSAGSYSWNAVYSGDSNNNGATSPCELLTVSDVITTTLSSPVITVGGYVTDSASLSGVSSSAGGTVTYYYYSGGSCSGSATQVGSPVTVTNGAVPNSASQQFNVASSYSWKAVYGGDVVNAGATSQCELLTVNPTLVPPGISVSPTTVSSGGSTTLTTTTPFSGGTPTYTCLWFEEAPGGSFVGLGSSFSCATSSMPSTSTGALSTTGIWYFELQVTDSSSTPVTVTSASVAVTVD